MTKILSLLCLLLPTIALCQEPEKRSEQKTKMDEFESKTGSIIKFVDTKLPHLKGGFNSAETRIRKITTSATTGYFYQIIKKGEYGSKTASIEYSDLLEVIEAMKVLISDSKNDQATAPDYMENKFVTDDGFQVGYYISKSKISWYITLEKYGRDNTLFIDDVTVIGSAFLEAKSTIESLKNKVK